MILNMQKFWRDYKVKNLVPQNNSVGVGCDPKIHPPDTNISSVPDSKEQRAESRKVLTTDGVGDCVKAKILAQFNLPNTDKTRRDSEASESTNPTEDRRKPTKYVIHSSGSTSN